MSLATISRPNTNEKKGSPDAPSLEHAPMLPPHIQAVGMHRRITKGSGYYWIGPAQSVPINDEGFVIKGIVLYNATNCLFLQREETQEAIQEAQQMLQTFFEGISRESEVRIETSDGDMQRETSASTSK